jgi:hypothetical protein
MDNETLKEVEQVQQGGIWTSDNLLGDTNWEGEKATKSETPEGTASIAASQTPAQEDAQTLLALLKEPECLAALVREIERKMLRDSGRPTGTSLLRQITQEQEESIKKVRDWFAAQQQTVSAAEKESMSEDKRRIAALSEKIASLELQVQELLSTTVTQNSREKEMIEEAYKIITERRREEIGSERTPSEITRMEQRTAELQTAIQRHTAQLAESPTTPTLVSAPARNRKKFGTLF